MKSSLISAICYALIAFSVCIVAVCSVIIYKTSQYKKAVSTLPENFTVTAHSGSMGTVQNSLNSIEVGTQNADIVEFDLNFNPKNEPVLSHDTPKGDEPTLAEAFEILAKHKNTKANVDLKSTANLPEIQALAEEYGVLEQIFFTGVSENWVKEVKHDCPKIPYYLNFSVDKRKSNNDSYIDEIIEKVKANNAIGLNFHHGGASKKLVDKLHENGLLVSIWTVDKKSTMYKILSFNPDNITTRKPALLKKVIALIFN